LGRRANAIIEEWNGLDGQVRAARTARLAVLRGYAERHGQRFDDTVAEPAPGAAGAPCTPPAPAHAPSLPDPANAVAADLARADDAFQTWVGPRQAYLMCRKAEGAALAHVFAAAKARYETARRAYGAYRAAFNAQTTRFEAALAAYTRKLAAPAPKHAR
jgi:hypothetical protein